MSKFELELQGLLNRCSMESGSNTPDFILAQYLCSCLNAFNVGVFERERWYGRAKTVDGKQFIELPTKETP